MKHVNNHIAQRAEAGRIMDEMLSQLCYMLDAKKIKYAMVHDELCIQCKDKAIAEALVKELLCEVDDKFIRVVYGKCE